MDLKTFRGPSTKHALRQVEKELGPDALVIETREVKGPRGLTEVEVVAAVDRAAREVASSRGASGPAELDFADLTELSRLAAGRTRRAPRPSPGARSQARAEPPVGSGSPEELVERLIACEVRPAIARLLVSEAAEAAAGAGGSEPASRLTERLAGRLTATLPPSTTRPRVLAFVGPTGVGKTTSAAKLAARLGSRLGKKVGLVSADWYRVGALEQLKTYADLMGIPFRPTRRLADLDTAIRSLRGSDWILIDTAGRSPREVARDVSWPPFLDERPWIQRILVLAANTRESDLDAAVDAFWGFAPRGLVFTKIDEARALGAVVNQCVRTGLPVGFLTNGQSVPEDLIVTSPRRMAEIVLGRRAQRTTR